MTHTRSQSLTLTLISLLSLSFAACAAQPNRAAGPAPVATVIAPAPAPALDRGAVRAKLANKRQVQIDRLRAYSDAGVFPRNQEQPGMLNLFIDDYGSICAAANLMWQDGHEDLVRTTSIANNTLRLATVTSGPLMDWILTSGLTQHEIDRIQEPYTFEEEPLEPLEPQIAVQVEVERLQKHFAVVLAELEKNWDASLDSATDKLARNAGNASLLASL